MVLLQHPKEQGHTKGTADLLRLSLSNCQIIVGEDFSGNEALNSLLANSPGQVYLLYPAEKAEILTSPTAQENTESGDAPRLPGHKVLLLLDATWKKAFKMYSLSSNLKQLPCLRLSDGLEGHYRIRKTSKKGALSTLEACSYALACLEPNNTGHKKLLESFEKFNDFQLSFRPDNH